MRHAFHTVLVAVALAAGTGVASARPFDAKALARYDRSYVDCEAADPAMKGQRDAAYLSLWNLAEDDRTKARLAKLRTDPVYLAETKRLARLPASAAAPASTVQRQCRGLWAEHQRAGHKRP